MIKRFVIAFILLVLVAGGIVGFNLFRERAIQQYFATMKAPPSTVSTVTVEPMEWTPGLEAIGTVSAVRGVDLAVETAGIVKEITFASNKKVAAGVLLVQLDDAVERADLEAQKAQNALDQVSLKRAQELQRRGVGSEVTLDTAQATATASAAQVTKLQAVLDQKQLTAPFAGTVGIPRVDLGQYLTPGTVVATLQDLDTMRVDFTVPEQQLPKLRMGQPVRLGTGGEAMPFTGSITGIDPKIDPSTRLASIRAEVGNPDGRLTPGQFVQVRVELPKEGNVLAVPQTALTTSLYGNFIFVVVPAKPAGAAPGDGKAPDKAADKAADKGADKATDKATGASAPKPAAGGEKPGLVLSQVFVKIGRHEGRLVEILEGVSAGDQVVTAGQNRLFNGMSVVVNNTVDLSKPAAQQAAQ